MTQPEEPHYKRQEGAMTQPKEPHNKSERKPWPTWANLSNIDTVEIREGTASLALDALSRTYALRYGERFRLKHVDAQMQHQAADARRVGKQIGELTERIAKVRSLPPEELAKPNTQEEMSHLVAQIASSGHFIDLLKSGLTYAQVEEKLQAEAHTDANKVCNSILHEIGSDCQEPGIIPSFLRAVQPSKQYMPKMSSPTWPILLTYPGLRTLNKEHSIHVIDGFLTNHEIDTLVSKAKLQQKEHVVEAKPLNLSAAQTLATGALVELEASLSRSLADMHKKTNKRSERHGKGKHAASALSRHDVNSEGSHPHSKHCRPSGFQKDPNQWYQTLGPLFEARGSSLKTCEDNKAFVQPDMRTLVCPGPSKVMNQVQSKIAHLVQGRIGQLEPMKVYHYREGEYNADHWDAQGLDDEAHTAKLFTVMVFLSDAHGGSTYFPNLDLRVAPKRGSALIFPLLNMDLNVMASALYAEEEVKRGDKWLLMTHLRLGTDNAHEDPCLVAHE